MDEAARAAFVISQAACLMAEVAGMQAENQHWLAAGQRIKYGEDAFITAAEKYQLGHNDVLAYLRGG